MKNLVLIILALVLTACAPGSKNTYTSSTYEFSFEIPETLMDTYDPITSYERDLSEDYELFEPIARFSFNLEGFTYQEINVTQKGGAVLYKTGADELDPEAKRWDLEPAQGTMEYWFYTTIFFGENYDYEIITSNEEQSVAQMDHEAFTDSFDW